jgi:hypothetical protein
VGSDPLRIRLRGLRPPMTSVLSTAGLWQWSILQRRGVVTHCWCDGGGGYPPSSGGGLRRFNAFQRLPCPLWWVPVRGPSECYPAAGYCVRRPRWGPRLFHCSKGRRCLEIFVGFGLRLPTRRRSQGIWLCNNGQCVA